MSSSAVVTKLEEVRQLKDSRFATAAEIVAAYDLQSLRNRLEGYPEKIREKRRIVAELARELRTIQREMAGVEARIQAEIAAEVDDKTGKPRFSNDTARKAEFEIRRRMDPEYARFAKDADRLEIELDNARNDLQMLEEERADLKTIITSMEAELRVLAG